MLSSSIDWFFVFIYIILVCLIDKKSELRLQLIDKEITDGKLLTAIITIFYIIKVAIIINRVLKYYNKNKYLKNWKLISEFPVLSQSMVHYLF